MFSRGFLNSDPRATFTTPAVIERKKILPQNPLLTFSESLDFVFQGVGCPGLSDRRRRGGGGYFSSRSLAWAHQATFRRVEPGAFMSRSSLPKALTFPLM